MFVYIWRFQVKEGLERDFEDAYGADGKWVRLFSRDGSYIRTELLRDIGHPNHFLTIDYWTTREACEAFRSRYREEFSSIDEQCESLTVREEHIGDFVMSGTS